MQPVPAAQGWELPEILTLGDLADWLCLSAGELDWYADLKALAARSRTPQLQHYNLRVIPKRSGGLRLIESPKSDLKALQRRILSGILDRVPMHPAVHGFVKGRSIVTFASPHLGKEMVMHLDLQDFFPGFPAARAQALFRTLGYPEQVADRLAGICTSAIPSGFWKGCPPQFTPDDWQAARETYSRTHLPQGAATSPALANLMAYRLDCRLSGLAKTANAAYTRYADDLAFSGGPDLARSAKLFSTHVAAIALEEGFTINHHKTRMMRRSVRQQIAGVVVNQTMNVRRQDVELLEATIVNCVRSGPASQNREERKDFRAHLQGKIGFVEMINRKKGQRLKRIFNAIEWER